MEDTNKELINSYLRVASLAGISARVYESTATMIESLTKDLRDYFFKNRYSLYRSGLGKADLSSVALLESILSIGEEQTSRNVRIASMMEKPLNEHDFDSYDCSDKALKIFREYISTNKLPMELDERVRIFVRTNRTCDDLDVGLDKLMSGGQHDSVHFCDSFNSRSQCYENWGENAVRALEEVG